MHEDEDQCNLFGNLTPRKEDTEDIDEALIKMSKKLMKYKLNVFLLQRVRTLMAAHLDYLGGIANSTLVLYYSSHKEPSFEKGIDT